MSRTVHDIYEKGIDLLHEKIARLTRERDEARALAAAVCDYLGAETLHGERCEGSTEVLRRARAALATAKETGDG